MAVTTHVPVFLGAVLAPLTSPKAFTLTAGFGVFGFLIVLTHPVEDILGFFGLYTVWLTVFGLVDLFLFSPASWFTTIYVLEDKLSVFYSYDDWTDIHIFCCCTI